MFPRFIIASLLALATAAALSGCGKSGTPTSANPVLDSTPPQAPSGILLTSDPGTGLRMLQWTPNAEPDLAKYQVSLYAPSPDRDNSYVPVAEITSGNRMRLPIVTDATTLYYRVRAVDATGNCSAASPVIVARLDASDINEPPGSSDPLPILRR